MTSMRRLLLPVLARKGPTSSVAGGNASAVLKHQRLPGNISGTLMSPYCCVATATRSLSGGIVRPDESKAREGPLGLPKNQKKLDEIDRWIVFKYGKINTYKSKDDVPRRVTKAEFDQAKSRFRMRVANYMMLATVVSCAVMIYIGRGYTIKDSTREKNLEKHREWTKQNGGAANDK